MCNSSSGDFTSHSG